jgi:hypothetical protein
MPTEGITYDSKALAAVTDSKPDWNALAKDVVTYFWPFIPQRGCVL